MIDPMYAGETLSRDEVEAAGRLWWVPLLYGLLSVVVGLFILAHNWTIGGLAGFFGVILIFEGVFTAATPGMGNMRNWSIGIGILAIIAGIAILIWPGRGLLLVAEVIAAYVVVKGTFTLVTAFGSRHVVNYWWLVVLLGILEIAVGIWLMRRPGATLYLVIVLTGIWLVVQGILQVVLAFEIRKLPRLVQGPRAEQAPSGG